MAQINQYANEAANIKDDDFFDLDLETSPGVYQSNKLKWGTIKTQLTIDRPELLRNLSNFNLTQTDNFRTYDLENSKSFEWRNAENVSTVLSGEGVLGRAARYNPNPTTTPPLQGNGATLDAELTGGQFIKRSWITTGSRAYRTLSPIVGGQPNGGCYWFGDHTNTGIFSGFQPNANYHAVFAAQDKQTMFTDVSFSSGETAPQDAIVWFRSLTKGVLFPNLTEAARNAIPTPRLGLVIFNTTANALQVFDNSLPNGWKSL